MLFIPHFFTIYCLNVGTDELPPFSLVPRGAPGVSWRISCPHGEVEEQLQNGYVFLFTHTRITNHKSLLYFHTLVFLFLDAIAAHQNYTSVPSFMYLGRPTLPRSLLWYVHSFLLLFFIKIILVPFCQYIFNELVLWNYIAILCYVEDVLLNEWKYMLVRN